MQKMWFYRNIMFSPWYSQHRIPWTEHYIYYQKEVDEILRVHYKESESEKFDTGYIEDKWDKRKPQIIYLTSLSWQKREQEKDKAY